jgi:hypothetical protein
MRLPMPVSGKAMTTCLPFMARAAAISEPMNPPPMTANRCPCSVSARNCW